LSDVDKRSWQLRQQQRWQQPRQSHRHSPLLRQACRRSLLLRRSSQQLSGDTSIIDPSRAEQKHKINPSPKVSTRLTTKKTKNTRTSSLAKSEIVNNEQSSPQAPPKPKELIKFRCYKIRQSQLNKNNSSNRKGRNRRKDDNIKTDESLLTPMDVITDCVLSELKGCM
jgi:hypothetical protein